MKLHECVAESRFYLRGRLQIYNRFELQIRMQHGKSIVLPKTLKYNTGIASSPMLI